MMELHGPYEISDDATRVNFAIVHRWLRETYWAKDIPCETVERAARYSAIVVGAYAADSAQVGYCRTVSDRTRFAYVADVTVDAGHRRRGLGRAMVSFLTRHAELAGVKNWLLTTQDAHGVYARLGFGASRNQHWFMQRWVGTSY